MGVRRTRYEQQVALTAVSEGEGNRSRPVDWPIARSRTGDRPARTRSIGGEGDALLAVRSLSSLSRQPESRRGRRFLRPGYRVPFVLAGSSSRPPRPSLVSIPERVIGSTPNGKGDRRGLLPSCAAGSGSSVSALDPRLPATGSDGAPP